MNIPKLLWRLSIAGALALSLMFNISFLIGGALYQMASSVFSDMTGIRTVATQHADEVAQLSKDLTTERAAKQKIRGELTEVSGKLSAERLAMREMRGEMADPLSRRVVFRGEKVALRDAVELTSHRISKRAIVTSSREVGAMAGEALPYVGIAVIVGVTALELKDLCDTLKDMSELKRAFSLKAPDDEDEKTVCAMKTPSHEELWELTKASPGKAWGAARDAVPTLEEIKDFELPDVDWSQAWSTAASGSQHAWSATKSGAGAATLKAKEAGIEFWNKLRKSEEGQEDEQQQ